MGKAPFLGKMKWQMGARARGGEDLPFSYLKKASREY